MTNILNGQAGLPAARGGRWWQSVHHLTVSGIAPSGAAQVRVHLESAGNSGTAWFDDVSFSG